MKNRKLWIQIVAWLLCLVLGYKLYDLVRDDREAYAEKIAQYQLQAAQSEELDEAKVESLTDIYDKFYNQVDVHNIICWGDTAMAGNNKTSLPSSLKKVIEENLFSSMKKTFNRVLENG